MPQTHLHPPARTRDSAWAVARYTETHRTLGPKLIMMQTMLADIAVFAVFGFAFLVAYGLAVFAALSANSWQAANPASAVRWCARP